MKCRQCGSEIADKALVCYRCGAATTEPRFKAPAVRQRRRSTMTLLASVLAIVLVALIALYATQFAGGETQPALRWAIVVLAAAIIVIRLVGRRFMR